MYLLMTDDETLASARMTDESRPAGHTPECENIMFTFGFVQDEIARE
jgi:hypothetical protein